MISFTYITQLKWYSDYNWEIVPTTEKQISNSDYHRNQLWNILEDLINNKILSFEPQTEESFYIELQGFYFQDNSIKLTKSIVERI